MSDVDDEEVASEVSDVIAAFGVPVVSFSLTIEAALNGSSSSTPVSALLFLDPALHSPPAPLASIHVAGRTVNFLFRTLDLPPLTTFPPLSPRPVLSTSDAARFRPHTNTALLHFRRGRSNVIAVTAGYASRTDGSWSDEPHWLVFVHHKGFVPLGEEPLPKRYKRVPVSVFEGRYDALPSRRFNSVNPSGVYRYVDPLQPGVSVGMEGVAGGGTLGGYLVEEKGPEEGAIFGLTNAHVLRARVQRHTEPEYEVRRITQPAPVDEVRSRVAELESRRSQLRTPGPEQQAQLRDIKRRLALLSSPEYLPSDEEMRRTVIGEVDPNLCVLGPQRTRVQQRLPAIGVDAAVFRYTGDRRITPGLTSIDVEQLNLSVTSDVLEWTHVTNEGEDIVIKVGRTTGHTLGTPISAPSAVNTRMVGDYEIIQRGDRGDLTDYHKRSANNL